MSSLDLMDRIRIEWAVQRVDFDLDARVPRARRRQIRHELRSNLTEAASTVGVQTAVRQLGDLHTLAKSYLEIYRGRWDFRAGSIAAVAVYAALQVLGLALLAGFSTGVLAGGGHAGSYQFWSGLGPFAGSASPTGFTVLVLSPAHLTLMALAFGIVSARRFIVRR